MNNDTLITLAVVGAIAVGAYLVYQKSQEQKEAKLIAANPNSRNQETGIAETVDAVVAGANGLMDIAERSWGGF